MALLAERGRFITREIGTLPERKVPLEVVPIRGEHTHDLAVIASIFHETDTDLQWYAQRLREEFTDGTRSVHVIFADNTPDGRHGATLDNVKGTLDTSGITCDHIRIPLPGKVHGLNGCLRRVAAPYILSVDPNKRPAQGTLRGLYEHINEQGVDLLSARIARNESRGNPLHVWNAGAAHIGARWCFPGFPRVLNDDEYTHRLTVLRHGTFDVAPELTVHDPKDDLLDQVQRAQRHARHTTGNTQLDHLTVYSSDGTEWNLGDFDTEGLKTEALSRDGLAKMWKHLMRMPLEERVAFPIGVLSKVLYRNKLNPYNNIYREEYLEELSKNPEICTW